MTFGLQFILKGALSLLWNVFNTLQLIMALNLMQVVLTSNIMFTFELLEDTINLQVVPKDLIYDTVIAKPFGLDTY